MARSIRSPKRRLTPRREAARAGKTKPAPVPLTMPIREAAAMIGCTWRTLLKMLDETHGDHCIVRIGNRRAVDRKRFAKWCHGQRISMELAS